jgi:diguanylate cyclase (GGDEF)-like protein
VLRSTRAAALGTVYTALLMTGVALWLDAGRVAHNPAVLLFPLALLVEAGYAGAIVGRSAMASRGAGIVDELTGLLNRTALGTRLIELEAQAASGTPRPVAVVLADLDHFKAVNDRYGHTAGDLVLREVAECIRTSLRGFDSAYRVGGEEFLLLLPDADADAAKQVAERLRQAVRSKLAGHSEVTISVGVAVSKPGARFVYGEVFGRADSALYEAKRAGRDRVCVDEQRPGTWPVSASSRAAVHAAWA